jgi:hypothetical protein
MKDLSAKREEGAERVQHRRHPCLTAPPFLQPAPNRHDVAQMQLSDGLVANEADHPAEGLAVACDSRGRTAHFVASPFEKRRGEGGNGERELWGLIARDMVPGWRHLGKVDKSGGVWIDGGHTKHPHRSHEGVFANCILPAVPTTTPDAVGSAAS